VQGIESDSLAMNERKKRDKKKKEKRSTSLQLLPPLQGCGNWP
jgi:hypothetical protein